MSVVFSNPPTVAEPDGQFSQAVLVKMPTNLLFISGQVPRNNDGQTVGQGNMTTQAEQVFSNLNAILEAHGSDFTKALKATIFVTDMKLAEEVIEVRKRFYGNSAPASTFVEVRALGDKDWMLEIELIAAL